MRLSIFAICCWVISITGCTQKESPPNDSPPLVVPKEPSESTPTKEETLDYLDGKSIPLTGLSSPNPKLYKLKKADIEALQFGDSAIKMGDGPWQATVHFITKTDEGRYAVKAEISSRLVDKKRAFYGFEVKEVAKQ